MDLRRIASALAGGFAAEVVSKLVPLVILHIVVTRIGAEAFGLAQFSYWLIDMAIAGVVFGYAYIGQIDVGTARGDPVAASRIVSEILVLKLAHAVLAFVALMAVVYSVPAYQKYVPVVLALSFILFTTALDLSYVHIGGARMLSLSVINIIVKLCSLIAVLIWVKTPDDALLFALLNFGTNGLIAVANFSLNLSWLTLPRPSLDGLKQRFRRSLPFALTVFLMLCLERFDVFVVEGLLGTQGAGLYGGPVRISQAFVHVVAAIGMVFFGEVVATTDRQSFTQHVNLGIWVTMALLFPMVIGTWFVGDDLLIAFFGAEYAGLGDLFFLLTATLLGHSLITVYGLQVLLVQRRGAWINTVLFTATVLGAVLALTFAATGGILAVGGATLVARWTAGLTLAALARPFITAYPWRELVRTGVPAVIMGVILFISQQAAAGLTWWALILIGAGSYTASLVAFNPTLRRRFKA